MDRFQVVGGDGYFFCPPVIDSVRVAMAILKRGPYTFLARGCHLEPGQQPDRQAPFYLCFHGNQLRFSQDVGDSCSLQFIANFFFFLLFLFLLTTFFFFASEKKLECSVSI